MVSDQWCVTGRLCRVCVLIMKLLVATGSFTKQTIIQKWICFELVHGPSYVLACFVLIIIFNVFYAEIIRKGYFFCRSIFGCRTELPGFLELFIGKKVALSWISGFSHEVYIQNIVCCLWDVQKHCQNILTVVLGCKYNKVYTARLSIHNNLKLPRYSTRWHLKRISFLLT